MTAAPATAPPIMVYAPLSDSFLACFFVAWPRGASVNACDSIYATANIDVKRKRIQRHGRERSKGQERGGIWDGKVRKKQQKPRKTREVCQSRTGGRTHRVPEERNEKRRRYASATQKREVLVGGATKPNQRDSTHAPPDKIRTMVTMTATICNRDGRDWIGDC